MKFDENFKKCPGLETMVTQSSACQIVAALFRVMSIPSASKGYGKVMLSAMCVCPHGGWESMSNDALGSYP